MEMCFVKDANGQIKKFIIGKTRVTLGQLFKGQLFNFGHGVGTIIDFDRRRGRCYKVEWDDYFEDTNHPASELLIHSGQKIASNNPNASFKAHRRKDK